jgi:hypothetical protein
VLHVPLLGALPTQHSGWGVRVLFDLGDYFFEFQNRVDEVTPEACLSMTKAWWGWAVLSCVILGWKLKNLFLNKRILSFADDAIKSKS